MASKTKVKTEVAKKIEEVVGILDSVKDELPGPAKAALGMLKSVMKEGLEADDLANIVHQLEEIDLALDSIDEDHCYSVAGGKPLSQKDLRTALTEILNTIDIMLREHSAIRTPSYTPKPYQEPVSLAVSPAPSRHRSFLVEGHLVEAVEGADGKAWEAVLIESGMSANKRFYPKEVLQKAYPLFEGVKAYVDHKTEGGKPTIERSVRDIAGWFENVACEDGAITAKFIVSEAQNWLRAMLKDAYEKGKEDLVGFSILAEGKTRLDKADSGAFWFVESIDKVHSVDVVTEPAAGGRLAALLESAQKEVKELEDITKITKEELKAIRPDLFEAEMSPEVTKAIKEALETLNSVKDELPGAVVAMMDKLAKLVYPEPGKGPVKEDITEQDTQLVIESELSDKVVNKIKTALRALNSVKGDLPKNILSLLEKLASSIYGSAKKESTEAKDMDKLIEQIQHKLAINESQAVLQESLASSDLPEPVKDKIRKRFANQVFKKEDLVAVIAEEKEVLGKLVEMPESPFKPRVRGMENSTDKIRKALEGMLVGQAIDGIAPFRSLKEAYSTFKNIPVLDVSAGQVLSEARGYSSEGRVLQESVATSSWAEVLGDSITRAMLREYRLPALEDWRKLCSEIGSIKDFRTQERIAMGGYGLLPVVTEGDVYQPLTSPTDDRLTWAVSKRGGLEDLTMETIVNDDLGAVKRIPKALARAAKTTLYRFVFDLIVNIGWRTTPDGSGIQRGVVNAITTALTDSSLSTAKQMMRDQTAYGEPVTFLQLSPKYLLVPNELEATAKKIETGEYAFRAASLPGGSDWIAHTTEVNIHRNTFETVVVDYWTNPAAWYLVADPNLANTIEIGFLDGKQEPELLTQDQPNVGSVFTADKISYKIRHIYGGVVLDFRSFFRGGV